VRRLCTGVEGGRGNIISCLSLARPSLSPRCNAALDAASLR
jgi:hypothetical protein